MASRTDDQFNLRLPPRMRPRIAKLAKANHRSMNSEIVFHLEKAIEALTRTASEGVAPPPKASPET